MHTKVLATAALLAAAFSVQQANAATFTYAFDGSGVSGSFTLTYSSTGYDVNGTTGYAITGITGTFSDSNAGINNKPTIENQTILGMISINPVNPLPATVLAPDFSQYAVATGVPAPDSPTPSPALSYDDTYFPTNSPVVCTEYQASGGFLDIYGVLFVLSDGLFVNFWSNGTFSPNAPVSYGVAVADANHTYDYVSTIDNSGSGVAPEPASLGILTLGATALIARRRNKIA